MATQAVAPREDAANNPIALFKSQLETRINDIRAALPAHITPDRFQRTVMTAVAQNPELLKADRNSLILACYKAAQDALLPDGREAAFVVFNTRYKDPDDGQWKSRKLVQYMPMVYGLRKKVLQSAEVVDIFASVVFKQEIEAGRFIYEEGTERTLRHKPILDPEFAPTDDDIALAYSVATFADGTKSFEVMFRRDINKVRECSQTGATRDKKGDPRQPSGPWVEWFPEQAKKSAIRRHTKTLPMSGDLLIDVEARELEMGGTARVLAVHPDAPQLEDRSEPPHNPETGELVSTGAEPPEPVKHDEEPGPDADEGNSNSTENEPPANNEAENQSDDGNSNSTVNDEAEFDQSADPADAAVANIIAGFDAAENLIDLNSRKKEAEKHTPFMSETHGQAIEEAYERNKKRLAPVKAAPKARAEEAAE